MPRCSAHAMVVGQTQTGKTTLLREKLLPEAPRWIALDRQGSYGDAADLSTQDPREAADALETAVEDGGELALAFHHPRDEAHHALAGYLYRLHDLEDGEAGPTVVVMDEAHQWGTGQSTPDELATLYTTGLQWGLLCVTVTQFPQFIPKRLRVLSGVKVATRTPEASLTDDLGVCFRDREGELAALEVLTPGQKAVQGRHFLTYPADLDLFDWWRREVRP